MRWRRHGLRLLTFLLTLVIALACSPSSVLPMVSAQPPEPPGGTTCELRFAPGDYNAYFNDDPVAMDSAPYILHDRMMVPFRLIGEALGASIGWDPSTREVSFHRAWDGKSIVLTIGDADAVVDGESVVMSVPPEIREGRTFVPLRFVSENMDAVVSWDGLARTATVVYSSPSAYIDSDGIRIVRPLPQAVCWPVGVRTAMAVVSVTNLRSEEALLAFTPEAETHQDGWLVIMHPQGSNLLLGPGETGKILATLEPDRDRFDGMSLDLPVAITDHGRSIASVNVKATYRERTDIRRTSTVKGRISGAGGEPIGGARVVVHLWSEMDRYERSSDSRGLYSVPVAPASALLQKRLLLSVEAEGYGYFSREIDYPLGQDEVVLDVTLHVAEQGMSFSLDKSPSTGFGVWRFDGSLDGAYVVSSPGVHADVPKSASMNACLFDSSGNVVWRRDLGDQAWGVSSSRDGDLFAFGGLDKRALVLDRSGDTVLDYRLDDYGESREVRLSGDGSYLGVGTVSGRFLLFDTQTDKLLWQHMSHGQVRGIVFRGDRVFVGTGDNNLYAFTLSGESLWKRPIVTFPLFLGASEDGALMVASGKSQEAIACDGQGNLLWRRKLDHNITSGDMAHDGSVTVLYSVSGNVWAFDRQGDLLFRRHMGQSTHNGVTVSPDGAYIAVGTTTGVCLLNRAGTVVWSQLRAGAGTGDAPRGANAVWLAPDLSVLFAGYEDGMVEAFRNTSLAAER